jgi:hypothetical protein
MVVSEAPDVDRGPRVFSGRLHARSLAKRVVRRDHLVASPSRDRCRRLGLEHPSGTLEREQGTVGEHGRDQLVRMLGRLEAQAAWNDRDQDRDAEDERRDRQPEVVRPAEDPRQDREGEQARGEGDTPPRRGLG